MNLKRLAMLMFTGIGVIGALAVLWSLSSAGGAATAAIPQVISSVPVVTKMEGAAVRRLLDTTPLHYVAIRGIDSGDCSTTLSACRTIQYAVDQAGVGDEIRIAAGVYTDVNTYTGLRQLVYISKTLTVRGGYTTTNWMVSDPAANPTTLDAQGQGRVIYITGDISPTVDGLRITGGDPTGLGGSTGVIGAGADAGGGLYAITATVILSGNQVFSNSARQGGGAFFYGSPDATLSHNVFDRNTTNNLAGGLYLRNSPGATLTANTISNNFAGGSGAMQHYGGARIDHSDNVTLISNTISGNHADNQCGGICFTGSGNATLIGNDIVDNSAGVFGFVNSAGGGLSFVSSMDATLIDNTISDNSSRTFGGGLYLERSDITMINNVIVGNQIVANSILTGSGSALYNAGSSPRLLHTTLARNGGGDGSGVYVTDVFGSFSAVAMTNTILVSHKVGIAVAAGSTVTLNGVLWYSNTTNYDGEGHITVTNEYTGNPAFDTDGYHLTAASAAIDRGVPGDVLTDIDGEPRPMGHGYDLGADELRIALTVTKQATPDPVQAGAPLTYTIRVTNTGNVTLNATITDVLPYGVAPTGVLTWRGVVLPPDDVWSEQVAVQARLCHSGTLSNLVRVKTLEGATGAYTETSAAIFTGHCVYLPIVRKNFPPLIQVPEGKYQLVEYWTFSVLGTGCSPLCIDFPTYGFNSQNGRLTIYSVFHPSPTLTLDDDDLGYFGRGTSLSGVGCGASSDLTIVGAYPFSSYGITLRYVDLTGTLTLQREGELISLEPDEAWMSAEEAEVWDWLGVGCVVTSTHRFTNYAFEDRDKVVYGP